MNIIKKSAIAFSLFAITGTTVAFAQTKEPVKTTKSEVKKDGKTTEKKVTTTTKSPKANHAVKKETKVVTTKESTPSKTTKPVTK